MHLILYASANFNSHAPWGAWQQYMRSSMKQRTFQLTRSVGSVTRLSFSYSSNNAVFQLTRSVGSVTDKNNKNNKNGGISTHTLRGERDTPKTNSTKTTAEFQLTRSVGSVTLYKHIICRYYRYFNSHAPWGAWPKSVTQKITQVVISTHTLRGERDFVICKKMKNKKNFNSHAPWGAWLKCNFFLTNM